MRTEIGHGRIAGFPDAAVHGPDVDDGWIGGINSDRINRACNGVVLPLGQSVTAGDWRRACGLPLRNRNRGNRQQCARFQLLDRIRGGGFERTFRVWVALVTERMAFPSLRRVPR